MPLLGLKRRFPVVVVLRSESEIWPVEMRQDGIRPEKAVPLIEAILIVGATEEGGGQMVAADFPPRPEERHIDARRADQRNVVMFEDENRARSRDAVSIQFSPLMAESLLHAFEQGIPPRCLRWSNSRERGREVEFWLVRYEKGKGNPANFVSGGARCQRIHPC
jgi:hypothetical protein